MKEKCKKLPDMGRSADLLQLGPGVVARQPDSAAGLSGGAEEWGRCGTRRG
jgi:hypothetical protein